MKKQPKCSRCGKEPRKAGQRWGAKCHAAYMVRWRKQKRKELVALRKAAAK